MMCNGEPSDSDAGNLDWFCERSGIFDYVPPDAYSSLPTAMAWCEQLGSLIKQVPDRFRDEHSLLLCYANFIALRESATAFCFGLPLGDLHNLALAAFFLREPFSEDELSVAPSELECLQDAISALRKKIDLAIIHREAFEIETFESLSAIAEAYLCNCPNMDVPELASAGAEHLFQSLLEITGNLSRLVRLKHLASEQTIH